MEIAFTVKNTSRAMKPAVDDVLLYDGKLWYITTKKELFKEYDIRFEEKIRECNTRIYEMQKEREQLIAELSKYKKELAEQMLEYGQLIKEVIQK